jgi:hypothetical protein
MTGRERGLDLAREATANRADAYGKPEALFEVIALRWSIRFGFKVSPRQVALCMLDMKIARADAGATGDTAVDIMGYGACLFEIDGGVA